MDSWALTDLPAGFDLVMQDNWRDTGGERVLHFLLTDGLASVSVYVESDPQEGLQGATRIGAVHAAGKRVMLDGWWLSVFPGLAITTLVVSLALIGDGLQRRSEASS